MKTELKDVLHLYLGCEGMIEKDYSQLLGISTNEDLINVVTKSGDDWINTIHFKPLLRPLSDMTEEELLFLKWHPGDELKHPVSQQNNRSLYMNEFLYLLKQGFDLFGLIESSHAIDKTKI